MTRRKKIALIAGGSVLGVLLLLVGAAFVVLQTDWFRDMVRERIVREVETATGGRVEIGRFDFRPLKLQAWVENFVIHGREPADAAPLFRARRVGVELKIISAFKRDIDIAALEIDEPQVNVIVFPDGRTNVPEPKVKRESDKSVLQTVVDLAVRRFELRNGLVSFASRKTPLNLRGENLRAQLLFDPVQTLYRGEIVTDPLYVDRDPGAPLAFRVTIPVVIDSDRIDVNNGRLETAKSNITLSATLENLANPHGSLKLNARLDPEEFDKTLALGLGAEARRAPPVMAQITAGFRDDQLHLAGARISMGASNLEASGVISDLAGPAGSLEFRSRIELREIGRLLRMEARPGGTVQLGGDLDFQSLKDYSFRGKLTARDVSAQRGGNRLTGISASSGVAVNPRRIELQGLRIQALDGTFAGNASVEQLRRFRVDGRLDHFDLERLTGTLAGQRQGWSGVVSGPVHVAGDLKRPEKDLAARARLRVTPGRGALPVSGDLTVDYDARRGTLDVGNSRLALPHTTLQVSGSLGRELRVQLTSTDLNDFLPLIPAASPGAPPQLPITLRNGQAVFTGTVTGTVQEPHLAGQVLLTNFALNGSSFDRLAAGLTASPLGVSLVNGTVQRRALMARFDASLGLRNWKPQPDSPLAAKASIQNADMKELAEIAGRQPGDFEGTLNATLALSGTYGDPRGTAEINALKGAVLGEPFDRLEARAQYAGNVLTVPSLRLESGTARLEMSGTYQHRADDLMNGAASLQVASNRIALEQFPVLRQRWPGLAGVLEFNAQASVNVQRPAGGQPQVRFTSLNGKLLASGVQLNTKAFGDLSLTAVTSGGAVQFQLASDFAKSSLRGEGQWQLTGNNPIDAKLQFSNVWLSSIREWLATGTPGSPTFDTFAEGRVTVTGPVFQPENLKGTLELTRFEAGPVSPGNSRALARVALRNDGPIVLALDRNVVRIAHARITGPDTELTASGTISLGQKNPLDLKIAGNTQLELVQDFYRDVFAGGAVTLNASIRGPLARPLITGRIDLNNASLNMPDLPNGISNANGTILFDGSQATIKEMTAETGGGKVMISGFASYGGAEVVFRMQAKATEVRVRYPPGVSTTANAELTLIGTTNRSTLTGTITIVRTGFNPRSDLGSILAQSSEPVRTPATKGGLLEGMRLDVQIQTDPNVQFQTALARDIQAEANLRLRGTAAIPALLGRITITQGELTFFGTQYEIQQGSIAFYNPVKIEPVLNIDLETRARGITVILNVSGPINRLNLTPRSDPPLQFSEIIALLATGRTPTSDPTLLARETSQSQSWQQMGASALLGEAIASPVSGRLQRLFGVSRLKIDPSFSGVDNNPQARLTLEQQITRDITFTYITNVARSNYQVVRVEWALNRNWSVIALREENGLVGLDFLYKKRFQ